MKSSKFVIVVESPEDFSYEEIREAISDQLQLGRSELSAFEDETAIKNLKAKVKEIFNDESYNEALARGATLRY